jgi:hypothetical protein
VLFADDQARGTDQARVHGLVAAEAGGSGRAPAEL